MILNWLLLLCLLVSVQAAGISADSDPESVAKEIARLVKKLRSKGSAEAHTEAAHALSDLATNSENEEVLRKNQEVIHEAGIIQAMTMALHGHEDSPEALQAIADCVANLAQYGHEHEMIKLLVKELRKPGGAQAQIAQALSNLAVNSDQDVHNVIFEEGALLALLAALRAGSPETQKAVADALANLAKFGHEQNVIKLLVKELRSKANPQAQAQAARALANVAANGEDEDVLRKNHEVIHEEGAIQALFTILRQDSQEAAEAQKAVTDALANLAKYEKAQSVVKLLVRELHKGSPEVQALVSGALAHVAANSQNHDFIHDEHAVQALVKVLMEGSMEGQKAVADALAHLAKYGRERDMIKQLVKALRKGNEGAQAHAACGLSNVAANNEDQDTFCQNFDMIKEEGGILALMKVLNDGGQDAQKAVADGLTNLAQYGREKEVVAQLIKALRKGSQGAQAHAASALSNLAVNSKDEEVRHRNHDAIHEEGAIQALVLVLHQSESSEVLQAGADTLANLAKYGREESVIKALKKVGMEGSQQAQEHAERALSNLAMNDEDLEAPTKQRLKMALKNLASKKQEQAPAMMVETDQNQCILLMLVIAGGVSVCIAIATSRSCSSSMPSEIGQSLLAA